MRTEKKKTDENNTVRRYRAYSKNNMLSNNGITQQQRNV